MADYPEWCEVTKPVAPVDHMEHRCMRPRHDHDPEDLHLCCCGHFWYGVSNLSPGA